jgi:hypothetical protein
VILVQPTWTSGSSFSVREQEGFWNLKLQKNLLYRLVSFARKPLRVVRRLCVPEEVENCIRVRGVGLGWLAEWLILVSVDRSSNNFT